MSRYTKVGRDLTSPEEVARLIEMLSDEGIVVPKRLVDVMMEMVSRKNVPISIFHPEGSSMISFRPLRVMLDGRDEVVLSDLNLMMNSDLRYGWRWMFGHRPGRSRSYSLSGTEALARYAELSEMPLVDYMAIMGAIDSGAEAYLIASFEGTKDAGKVMRYAWRFLLYTLTDESREFAKAIDPSGHRSDWNGEWTAYSHDLDVGPEKLRIGMPPHVFLVTSMVSEYGGPYVRRRSPQIPDGLDGLPGLEAIRP